MKVFKGSKRFLAILLAMSLIFSINAMAYYESTPRYLVAGGKEYKVSAILYQNSSTSYRGSVWAETTDASNVNPGIIGCKAKLCDGATGDMIYEGSWSYNTNSDYFHYSITPNYYYTSSIIAGGWVQLGTGTGFLQEPVNNTAVIGGNSSSSYAKSMIESNYSLLSTLNSDMTYPTNENGETYGSSLLSYIVGKEPDLIAAVGTNGVRGYVRLNDDSPVITCEADVISYYESIKKYHSVPLYDYHGNVIGSFELGICDEIYKDTDIQAVKDYYENEYVEKNDFAVEFGDSGERIYAPGEFDMARFQSQYLNNGKYPTTKDGKTYGPMDLIPGEFPDLISVRATDNGKRGYLRKEDYNPFREEDSIYFVYDLCGTIIGKFATGNLYE